MARLEFLDAGRGLAILGVMAVHTVQHFSTGIPSVDLALTAGQFGVQLFYIVSAYTMSFTLSLRIDKERHPVVNFWIRRYCRLAVPFWAGILVYEGFRAAQVGFFASTNADALSLVTSIFLAQGFWPSTLSAVIPGGGTIAIEAIFYVLFPAIFLLRGGVAKLAVIGVSAIALDHLVARPLYLLAFSASHTDFSPHEVQTFFYYYVLNQFPSFLFGIYLHQATVEGFRRRHLFAIVPFLVVYGMVSPKLAGVSSMGTLLLLGLMHLRHMPRWLIWTGKQSYSLYLFHFAVLNLLIMWTKPPEAAGIVTFVAHYAATVAGTMLVSLATKPLLENLGSNIGRYWVRENERGHFETKALA